MEINNNPSISLIPVILGEKPASQVRETERAGEKNEGSANQITRIISESEKQAAKQQLLNEPFEQSGNNLSKDESTSSESRAVSAYLETEQADQKNYLSDVLGIDVYT